MSRLCKNTDSPSQGNEDLLVNFCINKEEDGKNADISQNNLDSFLLENPFSGVFVLSCDNVVRYWNHYMEEVSGINKQDVIGSKFFEMFPEIHEVGFYDLVKDISSGKEKVIEKNNYPATIGKRIVINLHMQQILFDGGACTLLLMIDTSRGYKYQKTMERKVRLANFKTFTAQEQMAVNEKKFLVMYEISEMLRELIPVEEKLYLALTALTAGDGLGYNRASLFLVNEEKKSLDGKMGIGAISHSEASQIWSELTAKGKDIYDFVKEFDSISSVCKSDFDELIQSISIPMRASQSVPVRTAFEKTPVAMSYYPGSSEVNEEFGKAVFGERNLEFASIPLIVKDRVIGVILVDNIFTQHPIREEDIRTLMIFANQVAIAIENSRLYDGIHQKMEDLAQANKELDNAHKCLSRYDVLASLGKMAAGVAHEIRNPLNSMAINLQLLKEDISDMSDAKKEEPLELIQIVKDEIERLEDLVKEFTAYAKPSNIVFREVNLKQLVYQVLRLVKYSESRHNIQIRRIFSSKTTYIRGDTDQIKQAFLNITLNAIQAMPNGGSLCISDSYIELWEPAQQDSADNNASPEDNKVSMVCIKVTDTGEGMEPSVLRRVFEPFFTTKSNGTGLGLSIVDRIIRDHGGYIKAESEAEGGSTFKIFLPVIEGKDFN